MVFSVIKICDEAIHEIRLRQKYKKNSTAHRFDFQILLNVLEAVYKSLSL